MAQVTYTVKKGDTLWGISQTYNTTVDALLKLNPSITNRNLIYVGQVIIVSGEAAKPKTNYSSRATIDLFGLQSGTDRTIFATWTWSQSHTDHYEVIWTYSTGDGVSFVGNNSSTEYKQSLYTLPENAIYCTFKVRPISETYKSGDGDKDVSYWTASWSTEKTFHVNKIPPTAPPVPTVTIEDYVLTATLENLDSNAYDVEFQVVRDNGRSVYKSAKVWIPTFNTDEGKEYVDDVSYAFKVEAGSEYKVRARAIRGGLASEWSAYSDNVGTIPSPPKEITSLYALTETSVYISWPAVPTADGYTVEYTTDQSHFDSSNDVQSVTVESIVHHADILGLETGKQWFFRVRAENDKGESSWTAIKSLKIGTVPAAPTTYSSTTTAITGENVNLYWAHNSEDGSSQTYAQLELVIGGKTTVETIQNVAWKQSSATEYSTTASQAKYTSTWYDSYSFSSSNGFTLSGPNLITSSNVTDAVGCYRMFPMGDNTYIVYKCTSVSGTTMYLNGVVKAEELDQDRTLSHTIKTSGYTEGTKILWRVRTKGIMPDYGAWSIQRTIDVYAPPTMELHIKDWEGNDTSTIDALPFTVICIPGPDTQTPIGYQVDIISNDVYDTVDNVGRPVVVKKGDTVYSRYFNKNNNLTLRILPQHVSLENNVRYTIKVAAYMNSGLSAEDSRDIKVAWRFEDEYWPNAEIAYDKGTYTTLIRPYVTDEYGDLVSGTKLSVYRREFNGDFTEIATNLSNWSNSFVTDPHPALDYARYRIIATEQDTGKITYYDAPGYPIQEKAIIIQWDEEWTEFDVSENDEPEQPAWTGSLLRLPYNIDVSNSHSPDVSNVEYIGRKHPVSYYGTQLGETASWNVEIDKKDVDTLYAIRRLAAWMGNVYVREPSGSGYWANITVSFSQKHLELTIPVTFDITRVEGGM